MSQPTCQAEQRAAVRLAARELRADLVVFGAEPVAPRTSPTATWGLELLTEPRTGGVPPVVLETLADHGLTVRRVHRGGDCWRVLAVA